MLRSPFQTSQGPWLEADPQKFKQTVLHLLGNAVTYTVAGGQVSLSASQRRSWCEFQVADTGRGI